MVGLADVVGGASEAGPLEPFPGAVLEPHVPGEEGEVDDPRGPVAVLGDDELRVPLHLLLALLVVLVVLRAVEEEDEVGVLLDGPRLAEVAHHGPVVGALLDPAVQLGDGDDGDLELPGELLQAAADEGDLLLAVLLPAAAGPPPWPG